MEPRASYIVSGCRSPIGRYLGGLAPLSAIELAALSIRSAIARVERLSKDIIEDVYMGQVVSAGAGQAPARQALLKAGLAPKTGALTINKVCGSGLMAVMLADQAIRCGDRRAIIAAGVESMSQAPHLLFSGRSGWKYGPQTMQDAVAWDGLRCAIGSSMMGDYADHTASQWNVSREDQDAFALSSHQRAIAATLNGYFQNEIVPVTKSEFAALKSDVVSDESPRADSNLEKLGQLKPTFGPTGTVTAGNASPLSDGSAAVVVVDAEWAERSQTPWCFRIRSHAIFAAEPKEIFVAPVGAVRQAAEKASVSINEIELFELNEAFASQSLACIRQLEIPIDRVNIHGGAIALGHPLGCSGTRVLVTLMHAMLRTGKRLGCASLCLGGGEAVAMVIERTK